MSHVDMTSLTSTKIDKILCELLYVAALLEQDNFVHKFKKSTNQMDKLTLTYILLNIWHFEEHFVISES